MKFWAKSSFRSSAVCCRCRDYNQESGLFMNDAPPRWALCWKPSPSMGRMSPIVEALDHMLRTKLPRGIPLCIHLMSSQLVGDRIDSGLREFSGSGETG
ncbi:TraC family protein (plasmid) [Escherichia coli]